MIDMASYNLVDVPETKLYFDCIFRGFLPHQDTFNCLKFDKFHDIFNLPLFFTQKLFNCFDERRKGYLTAKQFSDGFFTLFYGCFEEKINLLCKLFDVNRDGYILTQDAKLIMVQLSVHKNFVNVKNIFNLIDTNMPDKRYSYEDFKRMTEENNSDLFDYFVFLMDKYCPIDEESISYFGNYISTENNVISTHINKIGKVTTNYHHLIKNSYEGEFEDLNALDMFQEDFEQLSVLDIKQNKRVVNSKQNSMKSTRYSTIILNDEIKRPMLFVNKYTKDNFKLVFINGKIFEMQNNKTFTKIILSWNSIELNLTKKILTIMTSCNVNYVYHITSENTENITQFFDETKTLSRYRDIHGKYIFDQVISNGHQSTVYKGFNRMTGEKVAIKVVKRTRQYSMLNMWEKEIFNFIQKCPFPNLIQPIDSFEEVDKYYFVFELINNPLTVKGLSDTELLDILFQIAQGIQHMHRFGIVHRDVKLENVLISKHKDEYIIKLIDFGFSEMIGREAQFEEKVGTITYCAPEILNGYSYSSKVDIWSMGVLTYYLKFNKYPFYDESIECVKSIIGKIINGKFDYPSEDCKVRYVIDNCLVKNPSRRISIDDLVVWLNEVRLN